MSALDELKRKKGQPTELELCILMSGSLENPEQAAAELLSLRSDLEGSKVRAKQAEENWHKNEARVRKLQELVKDLSHFNEAGEDAWLQERIEAALKGAE